MAGLWYRTGTVTLTSGSKNVTGYGTKWKSANPLPGKGSMLCGPDGKLYEVDIVADDTAMTLVSAYQGASGPGQGYALVLMSLTIPQFSTQLSQFVAKNSLFTSQINKLLTATGDVQLTDPDSGLVVTVPSWSKVTSEGEGQTARAKVEADRSKTEADRAVTEADRAASIVAAAALPLPDVWAPLSDSLRLITGYGAAVMLGAEVVAMLLSFSRSTTATYIGKDGLLRAAAVNEPRFEREGLLIEGPSTNIVKNSALYTTFGAGTVKTEGQTGPDGAASATKFDVTARYGGTNPDVMTPPTDGTVYTASVWLKGSQGGEVIRLGLHNGSIGLPVTLTTSWKRYQVTQTKAVGANAAFVIQSDIASASFYVFGAQLEALPFASSYIPTNGAAATRASDILYFTDKRNLPADFVYTVAAQTKLLGSLPGSYPRLFEQDSSVDKGPYFVAFTPHTFCQIPVDLSVQQTVVAINDAQSGVVTGFYKNQKNVAPSRAATKIPASAAMYICGRDWGGVSRAYYGHVRNFRIWHRALNDDQAKAIA